MSAQAAARGESDEKSARSGAVGSVILPAVAERKSSNTDVRAAAPRAPGKEREYGFRDLRQYVPADILDVSFPVSVRGYDRHAVDDHIKRVNRVIAELKVSASPPAAVRHALDVAGDKVDGLLDAAREAADEITASARQEAEESTARVKAAAAELVVNSSTEADGMRAEAEQLIDKAAAEAADIVAKARAEANEILSETKASAETSLTRSHAEAAERVQRLEDELAAARDRAETRMREIEKDTEALRKQRGELLDDIHARAHRLGELADTAATDMPPGDTAQPEQATPKPEAGD